VARHDTTRDERAAIIALLAGAMLFAGTHVAAKVATGGLPPLILTTLRIVSAALVYAIIFALHPKLGIAAILPPRELRLRILWCGFLAGPANQALFLAGVKLSHATHAALVYALTPLGVLLIAVALGRERWNPTRLVGTLVAFSGVIVLLVGGGLEAGTLLGDTLILVGVLAWVLYTLESRALATTWGGLRMAGWSMMAGGLFAALAAPFTLDIDAMQKAPASAWWLLAYLVLGTSVLAYFLWSYALARVEASRAAVFSHLQPVGTAVLSAILLAEPLGWTTLGGGALVIVGLRLAQRAR
jgi:drug/metabolite transporter (DMT)-like permease